MTDTYRYRVACKSEDCSWFLLARPVEASSIWKIRQLSNTHTCLLPNHGGNSSLTAEFLAHKILDQVRSQPDIKPSNLHKDLLATHGLHIPYKRVYQAKEHALKLINGTHEESYANIPKYCEELRAANPGTIIDYEATAISNQFSRLFLCFHASAQGFTNCKPLIGIDGTHVKSKFKGILLAATATDAQGQLFPLAFAVVDSENDAQWLWFLQKLRDVLMEHVPTILDVPDALTILSDRQKGLIQGVESIFPFSAHGYCVKHLERNLKIHHNHPELIKLLWKAASARSIPEFEKHMDNFRKISEHAYTWLINETNPENWVDCYFKGKRYGHYTSNIIESLNSWLRTAREQPLLPMLETIRSGLMDWFEKRRIEGQTFQANGFVPKVILNIMNHLLTILGYETNFKVDDRRSPISLQTSSGWYV